MSNYVPGTQKGSPQIPHPVVKESTKGYTGAIIAGAVTIVATTAFVSVALLHSYGVVTLPQSWFTSAVQLAAGNAPTKNLLIIEGIGVFGGGALIIYGKLGHRAAESRYRTALFKQQDAQKQANHAYLMTHFNNEPLWRYSGANIDRGQFRLDRPQGAYNQHTFIIRSMKDDRLYVSRAVGAGNNSCQAALEMCGYVSAPAKTTSQSQISGFADLFENFFLKR
jgi:hypothetical protein